jgi:hypothetical protein
VSETFTPGPWTVGDDDRNSQVVIEGPEFSICACHHHCVGSIEVEMRANAHLIAAAPDLLGEHRAWAQMFGEALVLAMQGDYSKVDELANVARLHFPDGSPELVSEAIAKAEGQPLTKAQG